MAEAQKMVHLTPVQRRRKRFHHPLTEGENLNHLLLEYFTIDEDSERRVEIGQELIMNYFCLLRSIVARYLFHWPVSRRFLDEMVSTGVVTITRIITELKPEQLDEEDRFKSLGGLIEWSIRLNIETIINDFRGIVPASRRTNHRREQEGKKPFYGNVEANLTGEKIKNSHEYVDFEPFIFEVRDALKKIAKTDLEEKILAPENWGLSHLELGKKIGKGARWVLAVRKRLRERYRKLGEKNA
jgi:hypothetical protein